MVLGLKFDPLSWAIGQGLSRLLSAATAKTLRQELDAAAEQWAASLPTDFAVYPQAIFRDPQISPAESRPALQALHDLLGEQKIPPKFRWSAALLEQWELIAKRGRDGEDVQSFFLKEEEEVIPWLEQLGERLHRACVSQERLFKVSAMEALDELRKAHSEKARKFPLPISPDVGVLELHQHIEITVDCRIDLVVLQSSGAALHVWGNGFGKAARDARDKLLRAAILGANFADLVFVGLADTTSLPRSDGQGSVGFLRIQFIREELLDISSNDVVPPGYWENKYAQIPGGDNSLFQQWRQVQWREVEEWK